MSLAIYGKDQIQKKWYLTSMKRMFVTGFCLTIKCTYLLILTSEHHIQKKVTSFCAKRSCAHLTEQYNNVELKTF